jgi:CRP-like cAMP-binding protein
MTTEAAVADALGAMTAPHRALLAAGSRVVTFAPGVFLFREGGTADTLYLLREGRVAIELFAPGRGAITIETVGPGDLVGWSWLFPPYRLHFDARALTAVTADAVDAAGLRARCEADTDFGVDLLTQLSRVLLDRLQSTRMRLLDVYGDPARG